MDLWEKVSKLMRQEIALAKAEVSQKAQHWKAELIGSVAGAALLLAGLLAIVAAIIALLAQFLPIWLASLLTGAAAMGAGYWLISQQRAWGSELKPERTLHNLKKDIQTFKEAGR
ncbi:MAG TPA: phage holin family protein [Polyangiaceae bacterium]|nr:phage holin family protein [Polyangiaceae bacterium]